MEYKKLSDANLKISRVGFGCWAIGGHGYGRVDDNESIEAIKKALDLGINFFDTADVYGFGHSEEILGLALGNKKHDVVIATKFGISWDESGKTYKDCNPKRICEALDASLKRLDIDCIPLYQVHWHDGKTPMSDIMETLQRCREKGKIRYIGCSNFTVDMILEASKTQKLVSLQTEYNLIQKDSRCDIKICFDDLNMGVLVYGVLARGFLSGKYASGHKFGESDTRIKDPNFFGDKLTKSLRIVKEVGRIGAVYHKIPSQIAIRWVLDNPSITSALIGMKTVPQVLENVGSTGWHLSANDMDYLTGIQ